MRVFVTGATGFVGTAVVSELISSGHAVLGLARSDASAAALEQAGAAVLRGELTDLDSLRRGTAEADGVIHAGFIHDFSKFLENCDIDRRAIEAMSEVLVGSDKSFIVTSGIGSLSAPGRLVTENDRPGSHLPRLSEQTAFAAIPNGVRAMSMRLPPSVHGAGDHGFVPMLINLAREKGVAAYVGDGSNRWPAVHRIDAARLYRLALESGTAGTCLHAIGDEGVAIRDIAQVIGKQLGLPAQSITPEQATGHFGWMAAFIQFDCPAASEITRQQFGWKPTQAGLMAELDSEIYFPR
jgi:nucleoside-diphosphate-sugar epimerase